jgi:hypothetical protein
MQYLIAHVLEDWASAATKSAKIATATTNTASRLGIAFVFLTNQNEAFSVTKHNQAQLSTSSRFKRHFHTTTRQLGPRAQSISSMAQAVFAVAQGKFGKQCVATRLIKAGESILLEEPVAVVKSEQLNQEQPDLDKPLSAEWLLTLELVRQGKDPKWCHQYVSTSVSGLPLEADVRSNTAIMQVVLRAAGKQDTPDNRSLTQTLYNIVCNNAFSLDTFILNLNYGSAFFELAAYFNHSCNPNATSLRIGGNMAMFAARDIAEGEEICHHYLPPHLLMSTKLHRTANLHFQCRCTRCENESAQDSLELNDLEFPADFHKGEPGKVRTSLIVFSKKPRGSFDSMVPAPAIFYLSITRFFWLLLDLNHFFL